MKTINKINFERFGYADILSETHTKFIFRDLNKINIRIESINEYLDDYSKYSKLDGKAIVKRESKYGIDKRTNEHMAKFIGKLAYKSLIRTKDLILEVQKDIKTRHYDEIMDAYSLNGKKSKRKYLLIMADIYNIAREIANLEPIVDQYITSLEHLRHNSDYLKNADYNGD